MTMRLPPICIGCAHYHGIAMPLEPDYAATAADKTGRCDAFPYPMSIPHAIWYNSADHRQPYAGDRGIRFQPVDDDATTMAEMIFDWQDTPEKTSKGRPA